MDRVGRNRGGLKGEEGGVVTRRVVEEKIEER